MSLQFSVLAAAALLVTLPTTESLASAAAPIGISGKLTVGIDYVEIDKASRRLVSKPEVLVFYSPLCPHCYRTNPELTAWAKDHPAANLVRKPIVLKKGKRVLVAMAARMVDKKDPSGKLRAELFDAVHVNRTVRGEDGLPAWMVAHGFPATWANDKAVRSEVDSDYALAVKLGVQGVPAMVVNGRYIVSPGRLANPMPTVVNYLLKLPK